MRHSAPSLLPFSFQQNPGSPVYEQIVFAVKRALACGELKPGDRFPSLRQLSRELRINPNTAQKVVTQLMNLGVLESEPGIGTVVKKATFPPKSDARQFLKKNMESLVIEARQLGLSQTELQSALDDACRKYPPLK